MTQPALSLPDDPPTELAAYIDGELPATARERVERLLSGRPELGDVAITQWQFSRKNNRFWESVTPPEPAESLWSATLAGIELAIARPHEPADTVVPAAAPARLESIRPKRPTTSFRRRSLGVIAALATTAAAAFLAASSGDHRGGVVTAPVDPAFQVATSGDVEIISILNTDVGMLVVGTPPLAPLDTQMATRDDVRVHRINPANEPGMPKAVIDGDSQIPMIFVPLYGGR